MEIEIFSCLGRIDESKTIVVKRQRVNINDILKISTATKELIIANDRAKAHGYKIKDITTLSPKERKVYFNIAQPTTEVLAYLGKIDEFRTLFVRTEQVNVNDIAKIKKAEEEFDNINQIIYQYNYAVRDISTLTKSDYERYSLNNVSDITEDSSFKL